MKKVKNWDSKSITSQKTQFLAKIDSIIVLNFFNRDRKIDKIERERAFSCIFEINVKYKEISWRIRKGRVGKMLKKSEMTTKLLQNDLQ